MDTQTNSTVDMSQERERGVREREAAAQRLRDDAEYARREAEGNVRRARDEATAAAEAAQDVRDERERAERDSQAREAALSERVRLFMCRLRGSEVVCGLVTNARGLLAPDHAVMSV